MRSTRSPTLACSRDLIPADRDPVLATMMRENIRPATIRAAGYIGAETDLRPVLPSVDVPTLILHGEADARSPLANAQTLHAAISTSQLAVLPQTRARVCRGGPPSVCDGDPPIRERRELTDHAATRARIAAADHRSAAVVSSRPVRSSGPGRRPPSRRAVRSTSPRRSCRPGARTTPGPRRVSVRRWRRSVCRAPVVRVGAGGS